MLACALLPGSLASLPARHHHLLYAMKRIALLSRFGCISLQVSVYQILKIAITPCLVGIEVAFYNKRPTAKVVYCILVLCIGVAMATVQVRSCFASQHR